jgi:hypothetical protein
MVDPNQAPQLFGNKEGVRIELVPVLSKSDPSLKHRYLFRATRSHSEHDGLVALAIREVQTNRIHLVTQFRGAPFVILHRYRSNRAQWTFGGYAPTTRDEKVHVLDEAFDPEELIRVREEQKGSELRKIEPNDRAGKQAAQQLQFERSMAEAEEKCGGAIDYSIDWSSVPDSYFENFSVASECWPPIAALDDHCEAHPEKARVLARSLSLTCRFQSNPFTDKIPFAVKQESPGKLVFLPGTGTSVIRPIRSFLREVTGEQERVFRLGDRHLLYKYGKDDLTIYLQDGNTYYPAAKSSMPDGSTFYLPSGAIQAELTFRANKWNLDCGRNKQPLEELEGAERKAILDAATLKTEPKWKRTPYFLSRDTHGTYYFVDRYKHDLGGKRYRVFMGRRGQLKLTKLKRLVEDSEGTLFSTAKGDLRLVVNRGTKSATWIRGKKQTQLTPVGIHQNRKLIYDELGVYLGEDLGLACE